MATFIFLTKFSFKLTSSSKWLIGSIGVQLSVGFSCNEFHFLLHKRLPCCSVCNIPSGTGIDKNPFQSNTSELDVYGGNISSTRLSGEGEIFILSDLVYISFLGSISICFFRFTNFDKMSLESTAITSSSTFGRIRIFPLYGIHISAA